VWFIWFRSDLVAAQHANNGGIGYMEQFDYDPAVRAFEEAVRRAPNWPPGRINLGIALLNRRSVEETQWAPNWLPKRIKDEIARRTYRKIEDLDRATQLFTRVLEEDPDNPYAHFCLGRICLSHERLSEAIFHFQAVTRVDPNDAHAWHCLSACQREGSVGEQQCLERAVALDPYLTPAVHRLAMIVRENDPGRARALMAEVAAVRAGQWDNDALATLGELGRYACVIGGPPVNVSVPRTGPLSIFIPAEDLQVSLRPGARWATAADFGTGAMGELRRRLRERFGATMVCLDYNRDGRIDLFLLGAVVEAGQVCDLLLRNDGGNRFTDVTNEVGLGGPCASLGCCVGDFDNNGCPDLLITGVNGLRLFRNTDVVGQSFIPVLLGPPGRGDPVGLALVGFGWGSSGLGPPVHRFEDVTHRAGLDALSGVALGAAFVDLDQDGDLDLIVARYADTPGQALAALAEKSVAAGAGLAVFLNVGEAPSELSGEDPPPLRPRFAGATGPATLVGNSAATVAVAVGDLDGDKDQDLVVLRDRDTPELILNDRALRFHRVPKPDTLLPPAAWNGALVLDATHSGRSDVFLVSADQAPCLLLHQSDSKRSGTAPGFRRETVESPPLLQAHAIDLDLDGWTDVVGLSAGLRPVLLHNECGRLVYAREALGRDVDWPRDLVALNVFDADGDGRPDLVVCSESKGLQLHTSADNGNRAVVLELAGHRRLNNRGSSSRCNADGFGAVAMVQAGHHWTAVENTTSSAGLGQSRRPLMLGLGPFAKPDVVRLRWPDNVCQAEFNIPVGRVTIINQDNRRRLSSCPVLFAWDGERFGFVTDFLGAGSLGELQPDWTCRQPRPEESIKLGSRQLVPLAGRYVFKLAEPMSEVTYLDRLQLIVLDHPAGVQVLPDERFCSSGKPPSQDLLALDEPVFPIRSRDYRGRDVTAALARWDRRTVGGFARRGWTGYAEEHWVELDFGDRLAAFGPDDGLVLCLAGWTDYPFPESIWAATQAGVALQPPVLERLGPDGRWRTVCADAGFPAGLPRMMTLDVTGRLGGGRCVLRLRTNIQVYWDQIYAAPLLERIAPQSIPAPGKPARFFRAVCREVSRASLEARGCMQEYSPDGQRPTVYDYDRLESAPVSGLTGQLTRTGDVTELLRERDDRFVIFGPGDELTVSFEAGGLPNLPPGWVRSFVLRTWGYCKDSGLFTATGDTIEPLPFQGMSAYPYGQGEHYPADPAHDKYRREYNTRVVEPEECWRRTRR
jgi:hypothetical protein